MQSMIFFEFGDIFRCNGSKVENKSVIGVLGKDITEDIFHFLSAVWDTSGQQVNICRGPLILSVEDGIQKDAAFQNKMAGIRGYRDPVDRPLKSVIDESILERAAGADSEILQSCLYGFCIHETSTSR